MFQSCSKAQKDDKAICVSDTEKTALAEICTDFSTNVLHYLLPQIILIFFLNSHFLKSDSAETRPARPLARYLYFNTNYEIKLRNCS